MTSEARAPAEAVEPRRLRMHGKGARRAKLTYGADRLNAVCVTRHRSLIYFPLVEISALLLSIDKKSGYAEKKRTERLQSFGLDERWLQDILFKSLDRLLPDDELLLIMQSRRWRESRI